MQENNLPVVRKVLGDTSIEELTGVSKGNDVVLVNVNRAALLINCGTCNDFIAATNMTEGIKGAVWNEKGITLILNDRYTTIKYEPTLHPLAEMFLHPQGMEYGHQWCGEFKPVKFTKADLVKFLKSIEIYGGTEELVKEVIDMKMRESRHERDTISLDEEKTSTFVEESFSTNIPKRFSLRIPVTPDFIGEFRFETTIEKPSERASGAGNKLIVLTCLNPMDLLRANVQHVMDGIPKDIPRLYGTMEIKSRGERW